MGDTYNKEATNFDNTIARIEKVGLKKIRDNDGIIVYESPNANMPNTISVISFREQGSYSETEVYSTQ
jgi:hypothetical protein